MIYERNNRKISQQIAHKNGSCSCLWTLQVVVFGRYNVVKVTTQASFYYPLALLSYNGQVLLPLLPSLTPLALPDTSCPPWYLQWTVSSRSNLQRSTQNGFCPRISETETGDFIQDCQSHCFRGFIQDCQPHSSYHIPHHASSDMCHRVGNDDSLHGWNVSTMQNYTIYLRVRWIGDIGGATSVKT